VIDARTVACPECAQQPGEECKWEVSEHPRYHAQRIEAAAFIGVVESGANDDSVRLTDEQIRAAIDAAANSLV
jgi:hypothetical protein